MQVKAASPSVASGPTVAGLLVISGHLEGIIVIGQIARGEPEEGRTGETLKKISKA